MKSELLIGTHYHPGDGEALRRQADANQLMCALTGVQRVNLQFAERPVIERAGFTTVPRLRNDSCKATGSSARLTPMLNEMCGLLAELAVERNLPYFMLVSSDEMVLPPAVDLVLSQGLDGYIFSRMDFSRETGEDIGMFSGGQGCWVFQTDWWRRNGWRIRPFVFGESYFDNITTTKLLCHGRARLFNRSGEFVRHEMHPRVWPNSPFLQHTRYMASLDSLYLSIWHEYIGCLNKLRETHASEAEEIALQERVFNYRPSLVARLVQAGRSQKAHLRYCMQRCAGKLRQSQPISSRWGSRG